MELSVDNFITAISWLEYLSMYPDDVSRILTFGIEKSIKFQQYKEEHSGKRTLRQNQ